MKSTFFTNSDGCKRTQPYVNVETAAYCTAINILAVEYLVVKQDYAEYSRRVHQVCKLEDDDLSVLYISLALNMHTSTLGAMITQGDYETQRENLIDFLDERERLMQNETP